MLIISKCPLVKIKCGILSSSVTSGGNRGGRDCVLNYGDHHSKRPPEEVVLYVHSFLERLSAGERDGER